MECWSDGLNDGLMMTDRMEGVMEGGRDWWMEGVMDWWMIDG